ncbi:hypothetical protein [Pseudomonas sp. LS-2]|jgi:hypothetical protein|uniref:hypothetical protein n=1 Tax=Pseudomonas sp. LS-2 TaxID=2315859 RepID=UPI000E7560B4|nr:hypothetical protein [Pseudomonas sp. LS-2]RJX76962.1 hypothetical protein D3M70_20975 [Pseudomonas sp. LS-2]
MKQYEIVFSGQLVPGAQLDRVQANLAKLFQADTQRIALLFSGRRLVLKNNLDPAAAEKYRSTLERAGARVDVVEMAVQVKAEPDPQSEPVEVEEVELAPPPDEPTWTRRTRQSSSPAGSPPGAQKTSKLEPRDVYMAAFVDVQAPDFTISELGKDVQDPKTPAVAPRLDLSGFSLAPAGSDMGEAKSQEHVRVPDTSHLKLA